MKDAVTPSQLRSFFDRLVTISATMREAREDTAEIKKEDPNKTVDWSRLCALAAAYDADQHDAKKKNRVNILIKKAEYASWYATILKIGSEKDEQIEPTRSSSPERPAPQKRTLVSVPREAPKSPPIEEEPATEFSEKPSPSPSPHGSRIDAGSLSIGRPTNATSIAQAGYGLPDDEFNEIPKDCVRTESKVLQ